MLRQFFLVTLSSLICFGARAADQPARLPLGGYTSIELTENRTTGYVWRIDPEASANLDILRIEDAGRSIPRGHDDRAELIGAPGIHRWRVEALAKGRAHIEFVLQRSWEPASVDRKGVDIEVGD